MRSDFTVSATAKTKEATAPKRRSLSSRAFANTYNSSRGGTRTPDPVINSHLPPLPKEAGHPRQCRQTATAVHPKRLLSATVSATALRARA
jgi:hypothetical protein